MEKLTQIWTMIQPFLITAFSFLGAVLIPVVTKAVLNKLLNKKDNNQFAETVAQNVTKELGGMVFSHDISPVVESSMIKIEEHAKHVLANEIKEMKTQYLVILEVLKQLSAYFDNSIGVSEEQKEKLKQVIEVAEQSVLKKDVITTKVKPVEKKEKTIIER